MSSSWSELPHELLGLFAAGLPFPNDRASFRAVCRSWCLARRHHHVQTRQLIFNVLEGHFMTPSDGCSHPLPSFPDNASCIGSTDDWLALRCGDINGHHNYFVYNPFSKATVQLPVLDTIIHKSRKVRKVLVRSTADNLIVAITIDSLESPFILSHRGNSAWSLESWKLVYKYIIDIAFLEGKLYAITQDEDLFPIDVDLDGQGNLMVDDGKRTIRQPPSYYGYHGWSASEDENADEEEGAALSDEEAAWTSDEDHDDNEEREAGESYEDNDDIKEVKGMTLENEKATCEKEGSASSYEHHDENEREEAGASDDNEESQAATLENVLEFGLEP
ncbi:hypothetical protein ACQ4PT_029074 [Festuca glaucescens]